MKITPEISMEIQKLMLKHSYRKICEIIQEKYNVKLCPASVMKHAKELKSQRAEVTKKVVQEYIQESIPQDLEILKNLIMDLKQSYEDTDTTLRDKLSIADRLDKIINTRLKYSGAGEEDKEFEIKWVEDIDKDEDEPEPEQEETNTNAIGLEIADEEKQDDDE